MVFDRPPNVMAGLDPAIHAFLPTPCCAMKGVDGPVKPGHDGVTQ
jgi:hypothetical protein